MEHTVKDEWLSLPPEKWPECAKRLYKLRAELAKRVLNQEKKRGDKP